MFKFVWFRLILFQYFSSRRCTFLTLIAIFSVIFLSFLFLKSSTFASTNLKLAIATTNTSNTVTFIAETACHYEEDGSKTIPLLQFTNRTIFFIESSCRGRLNSREACSVEAAAKVNPNWNILVMYAGPFNKRDITYQILKNYSNVHFKRLNITTLSKDTPIQKFIKYDRLKTSLFKVSHTADVLRWLVLYKYGGLYLDMDTIALKSFDSLPKNFAAKESPEHIACGIVAFKKERSFVNLILRLLPRSYIPDERSSIGPVLLTTAFQVICKTKEMNKIKPLICAGFHVMSKDLFYPIWYAQTLRLFKDEELQLNKEVYTVHMWNHIINEHNLTIYPRSAYAMLARKVCPNVYDHFVPNFGV